MAMPEFSNIGMLESQNSRTKRQSSHQKKFKTVFSRTDKGLPVRELGLSNIPMFESSRTKRELLYLSNKLGYPVASPIDGPSTISLP